jgi:hypothetical protein
VRVSRGAGKLALRLRIDDGRVCGVAVKPRMERAIARTLEGRPIAETLSLVPLLFPVCGVAQSVAALRALEAAAGHAEPAPLTQARQALLLAEAASSHAWRLGVEWTRLTGEPARLSELKTVRQAAGRWPGLVFADPDWVRPGGTEIAPNPEAERLVDRIGAALASLTVGRTALPVHVDELDRWLARVDTPAASLIRRVRAAGLERAGLHPWPLLPEIGASRFAGWLRRLPEFALAPTVAGRPAEVGAFGAHVGHPLIVSAVRQYGRGLLARLLAQLVDAGRTVTELGAVTEALGPWAPERTVAVASGEGCGLAVTSRGPLAHWVSVRDGTVQAYRAVAPTEWNFHPRGPLVSGLLGLSADESLSDTVLMLVQALDPCVPVEVTVEEKVVRTGVGA